MATIPMCRIVETSGPLATAVSGVEHLVAPLDPGVLHRHAPFAHYIGLRGDQQVSRCSIWTQSTPMREGQPIGVIGHYAAFDAPAGVAVLRHAIEVLRQRGLAKAVGPMDGNTWRRYRLLTRRGAEPPFFLEPDNPDDWPDHFIAAGFTPLATYFSALNDDLSITDPRVSEAMARLKETGITLRNIDLSRYEEELTAVHELSLESFAENFLYTPITRQEFVETYLPLRPHLKPELVLLAEKESRLIGFIFGIPDLAQAQRGEPITNAIAKSMAVRPGRTGAGLGSVLMDEFQQSARRAGFTRVIHALMHENNRSMKISARFGQPIRQYTLYAAER